jgi:crossover junction endodeoxyribonuclease RuvC
MTLLAVDPGINNGFAVFDGEQKLLLASEFPIAGEGAGRRLLLGGLRDLIAKFSVTSCILEDGQAMPRQGVSSVYRYARACGQIEGALNALGVAVTFVRPAVWKKHYGTAAGSKNGMRALAAQRWPEHQDRFVLVKHEHRAEAALLGAWWLRKQSA